MLKKLIDLNMLILSIVAFIAAVINLFFQIHWLNVLIQITCFGVVFWNWYKIYRENQDLIYIEHEMTWRMQIAVRYLNDLEFECQEKGRISLAGKVGKIRDILTGKAYECKEM